MKKALALLMTVALFACSFAACQQNETPDPTPAQQDQNKTVRATSNRASRTTVRSRPEHRKNPLFGRSPVTLHPSTSTLAKTPRPLP